MDAVARFGSVHGCTVRIGALKGIDLARLKNVMGDFLWFVSLFVQRNEHQTPLASETTDR